MVPPEDDDHSGYGAPGASEDGSMECASLGSTVRTLAVVIGTACGGGRGHAHLRDGGSGRDGSADAGVRAAAIPRQRGVAFADEPSEAIQGERTRVILVLQKPEGWDGSAVVADRARPDSPFVDTGEAINPDAVRETREAILVTLVLKCKADGSFTDLNVQVGLGGGAATAQWNLKVQTPGLMHTFESLPPTNIFQYLRTAAAPALGAGDSSLVFGPRQWINDGIKYTAGGKVTNATDAPKLVIVTTDQSYVLVSGGEVMLPENFVVAPGESFEVIVYTDDLICPADPANIRVELQDLP